MSEIEIEGRLCDVTERADGQFHICTYTESGEFFSQSGLKDIAIARLLRLVNESEAAYAEKDPEEQFLLELERLMDGESGDAIRSHDKWKDLFISRWGPAAPLREKAPFLITGGLSVAGCLTAGSITVDTGPILPKMKLTLCDNDANPLDVNAFGTSAVQVVNMMSGAPTPAAFTPDDFERIQLALLPQYKRKIAASLSVGQCTAGLEGDLPMCVAGPLASFFSDQGWEVAIREHFAHPQKAILVFSTPEKDRR